jgi:pimeloyl-ACP methyl ester carboxylesterase
VARAIRLRALSVALVLLQAVASAATQAPAPPQPIPPDQFFDSNGVRIRYVEQGQGTPVVLIHGYTGTLERHWINPGVFARLAANYRVIAFDCRGHGKSGKPADPAAYGAQMGQDVVRLLDHLKIPRAHIIGYSMGAIIAGHLLTTNPDRFLTATLVGHHAVRTWTAADAEESEASARELEGDTPFRSLVLGLTPANTPPPTDDQIREFAKGLVATNDLKALAAYNRGRAKLVVTDAALGAVRVPTLGIIGSADPSVGSVRALGPVMPAITVVVVDGATHGGEGGVMRRPEFWAALEPFLAVSR